MRGKLKKAAALALAAVVLLMALPMVASAAEEENGDYQLLAITFDDGPGPYTEGLLDALAERNVKATFFMVGNLAKRYPDLVARMAEEGHQLGNHTWDHSDLSKLSAAKIQDKLDSTQSLLEELGGAETTCYIRPPYGALNSTVKKTAQAPLILWSVDPLDWKYRNADTVYNNIMGAVKDGDIILLHDIHETSVKAAVRVIDKLLGQGYEFVTVSELFRRRGVEPENGVSYFSARNKGVNLGPLEPEPEPVDPEAYDEALLDQHPAYPSIRYVRFRGLYPAEGDFGPNKYMTRGLYAEMLGKFDKVAINNFAPCAFKDVPVDAEYARYISWADWRGFMTGYGGGLFGPEDRITREQLAAILVRYLSSLGLAPTTSGASARYTDYAQISPWARDGVDICTATGLLAGRDDGSFDPHGYATRAECAIIFERMAQRISPYEYECEIAEMNGLPLPEPPAGAEPEPEPEPENETLGPSAAAAKMSASDGVTAAAGVAAAAALFVSDRKKEKKS